MSTLPFRRVLAPIPLASFPARDYVAGLVEKDPSMDCQYLHVEPMQGPEAAANSAALAEELADRHAIPREKIHIRHGDLLDELLVAAVEFQSDLIVAGHQLAHGRRRSLARRLAMKAPCSVWLAPDGAPAGVSNILVPVDFSPMSADVLKTAAAIALAHGLSRITCLHVYFDEAVVSYEEHHDRLEEKEAFDFDTFLSRIDLGDIDVQQVWEESPHVCDTILRKARELGSDLIVMGTRGRSRSASILLGSETDHTFMDSHIPALAVKHFGAHLGFLQVLLDKRFRRGEGQRFG